MYAVIGMEIFGGLVHHHGYINVTESHLYCGNPRLKGSEFYAKQYCSNNFNDVAHAFVLLFNLMVVNQWHNILLEIDHLGHDHLFVHPNSPIHSSLRLSNQPTNHPPIHSSVHPFIHSSIYPATDFFISMGFHVSKNNLLINVICYIFLNSLHF